MEAKWLGSMYSKETTNAIGLQRLEAEFGFQVFQCVGINSISELQLELFVHTTDSEIIEDWVDHKFMMACTSTPHARSMSDIVAIDVHKFHFTPACIAHYSIHLD